MSVWVGLRNSLIYRVGSVADALTVATSQHSSLIPNLRILGSMHPIIGQDILYDGEPVPFLEITPRISY